jgi:hypothetical protein
MVAAILCQDDRLLNWLKIVAEIRYNTELCEEYHAVLLDEDLFQWRNDFSKRHEVYKYALSIVDDIESRLAAGVRYGSPKI